MEKIALITSFLLNFTLSIIILINLFDFYYKKLDHLRIYGILIKFLPFTHKLIKQPKVNNL